MDELNKRILDIMDRLSLNKSAFAKELDISLPLITHISTGRNKPGLDLIQKVLLKFEQIDPDWLLNGKGEMYRKKPQRPDYTDIYTRVDQLRVAIQGQEAVNETIKDYHKILLDEIRHLEEMSSMIEESSRNLKQIKPELERIKKRVRI